jgi:copper(I)-binding protein
VLFALALLTACQSEASSEPQVKIEDAWSRPARMMEGDAQSAGNAGKGMAHGQTGTGAIFMRLVNTGGEADRLTSARSDVAEVVEIHETRMEGEVMKMQHLPDGIELPAGGQVELKPGGYHIMLIGLKRDLKEGDQVRLELEFEKSGRKTANAQVRQP